MVSVLLESEFVLGVDSVWKPLQLRGLHRVGSRSLRCHEKELGSQKISGLLCISSAVAKNFTCSRFVRRCNVVSEKAFSAMKLRCGSMCTFSIGA